MKKNTADTAQIHAALRYECICTVPFVFFFIIPMFSLMKSVFLYDSIISWIKIN